MNEEYSWINDPKDKMMLVIKKNGVQIFQIFLGEAMEFAGYTKVMEHVRECNKSPWLRRWHDEKIDAEVKVLRGN